MIQDQVTLSWRVAVGVVAQGIRIRFGRSLITVTGVVLGIAFLMSNLAGQLIKDAVKDEDRKRTEVRRMESFLTAEIGPVAGHTLGVIQAGPLGEVEQRLLTQLANDGLRQLRWTRQGVHEAPPSIGRVVVERVSPTEAGRGASAVLLLGEGGLPDSVKTREGLAAVVSSTANKILAVAHPYPELPAADSVSVVPLAREQTDVELAAARHAAETARFRTFWIVVISLVVTVAGIANAMLMSVTERFREIGTLKCLGALSAFIRWIFFIESSFLGAVGGAVGACFGACSAVLVYGCVYGFAPVLAATDFAQMLLFMLLSVLAGVALSVVAAIYPAAVAASMVPAHALRTNI